MKPENDTHDVMVRPDKQIYLKIKAIAAAEKRHPGPQALLFVEEGINRYLKDHPHVAEQLQAQA